SAAAYHHYECGRWDDALQAIGAVAADQLDDMLRDVRGVAALIAVHRGDLETAAGHLAAGSGRAPRDAESYEAIEYALLDAVALLAEAAGDLGRSLQLRAAWLHLPPGMQRRNGVTLAPELVRLATTMGDRATAQAALALAEEEAAAGSAFPTA